MKSSTLNIQLAVSAEQTEVGSQADRLLLTSHFPFTHASSAMSSRT